MRTQGIKGLHDRARKWVFGSKYTQSPTVDVLHDIQGLSVVFRTDFPPKLLLRDTINGLSALELEPQD